MFSAVNLLNGLWPKELIPGNDIETRFETLKQFSKYIRKVLYIGVHGHLHCYLIRFQMFYSVSSSEEFYAFDDYVEEEKPDPSVVTNPGPER